MHRFVRKVLRAVADRDPEYYDMYADASEACYATLYTEWIMRHAATAGIRPPATLLEAGCQAGRLVVPLAKQGFQVTGIDTSGFALRRAREHIRAEGVAATLIRGNLLRVLRRPPRRQYDIVICAEVLYLSPRYREILQMLAEVLRPGGLLCVSHRPKFYYLFQALRRYDYPTALRVLAHDEGSVGESAYFNWQTEEELRALYASLGLRWIALHPVDQLAWLSGISPARMTETLREIWMRRELQGVAGMGSCARFLLVVAARPNTEGDR